MNISRTFPIMACFITFNFIMSQHVNASSYIAEKIRASSPTPRNKIENVAKKDWTFLVYMATNSNLSKASIKSLKQMLNVGSTSNINIVAQIDKQGETDIERIYIQKNKAILLEINSQVTEPVAGTAQSFYNFIKWGVANFPSDKIAILLWNNGSGIKDINLLDKVLITHRDQIYTINSKNGLNEINYRFANNFNLMKKIEKNYAKLFELDTKTTSTDNEISAKNYSHIYINNQDLKNTLDKVKQELLNNKKIDLILMDSCHMAMVEVASQIKNSTKYLVASQEIEPDSGYNYELLLSPFLNGTLAADAFANHAVASFEKEYSSRYAQYTQSVISLDQIGKVEQNIKKLTAALLKLIEIDSDMTIGAIKSVRSSGRFTTEFYDADYIDLCHFYKSLILMVDTLKKPNRWFAATEDYVKNLDAIKILAQDAIKFMQNVVIKLTSSKYISGANGISIYFPKRKVRESYLETSFDQGTQWSLFLNSYIQAAKKIDNSKIEASLEVMADEAEKKALTKSIQAKNDKKNKPVAGKKNKPKVVAKSQPKPTAKTQPKVTAKPQPKPTAKAQAKLAAEKNTKQAQKKTTQKPAANKNTKQANKSSKPKK